MKKEYALYRGDEFVDLVTLRELSEGLGKNPKTILFYGTPANIRMPEDRTTKILHWSEKYGNWITKGGSVSLGRHEFYDYNF